MRLIKDVINAAMSISAHVLISSKWATFIQLAIFGEVSSGSIFIHVWGRSNGDIAKCQ